MNNKFKINMSDMTYAEIVNIITIDREKHNIETIKSAESELKTRQELKDSEMNMKNESIPKLEIEQNPLVTKTYVGEESEVKARFRKDSVKMEKKGYFPTTQSWTPGTYGCGAFLGALFLCIIFIGFLIFIYMIIVKPNGSLTVTYELKNQTKAIDNTDKKECPQCAEDVKFKAKICRYCKHEFTINHID